jgi:predicted adenine nucleotide alpha hydrolase (AANH) superfamily ATPase
MDRLLLHVCCGPCATHVIELLSQQYQVTAFFYNPNIWPEKEYDKRLTTLQKYCEIKNIEVIAGGYEHALWLQKAIPYKDDREGGRRCELCYTVRLEETALTAKQHGIKLFTTTLSISPHKNVAVINRAGYESGQKHGVIFLAEDFKKKDGFKKSSELSTRYGLYRQNYCGCEFSGKITGD